MSENLPKISDVNLPASVEGGILNAVSSCIGGVAAYLGAWMRRPRHAVDDVTEARSFVTQELAKEVAERLTANEEVMSAAIKKLAPTYVKREANKLLVAQAAAEDLRDKAERAGGETPPLGDPDEDWLSSFERFAEDASSPRLQTLLGKILGGEIAQPGAFSKATLRYLFELDRETLERIADAASCVIGNVIVTETPGGITLSDAVELEANGIVTQATGLHTNITNPQQGGSGTAIQKMGFILYGQGTLPVPCAPLTRVGREIMSLLPTNIERERKLALGLSDLAKTNGFTGFAIGPLTGDLVLGHHWVWGER